MPSSRTRTRIVIAVCATLVVAAAAVPAAFLLRARLAEQHFRDAATAFAAAWRGGRLETVAYRGTAGAEVARQAAALTAGLTPTTKDTPASVDVLGTKGPTDGAGTVSLRVTWKLAQDRTWQYDTSAPLRDVDGAWRVEWSPAVVHPKLAAGQVLTTSRTPAGRGQIVGAGGEVLVTQRQVVNVGIQPGRAKDRRASAASVAAVVKVDPADLTRRVLAAPANAFVDVITLREEDYQAVRAQLQPIPGAVFQRTARSLGPSAGFARALLGTTGPATKEIVDAAKGRVGANDVTGLSGLQRRYDAQLAGTPGLTVQAGPAATAATATAAGSTAAGSTGATGATGTAAKGTPVTLFSAPAADGKDLVLTLDVGTQQAAEAALAASTKPAALVAIRASTGEVLAVANGPAAAAGYNRALIGRYPPGSTFKVATGFALLQSGLTPDTPVPCPAKITVNGRTFQNAEGEVLGTAPFHRNFADSCNTAFIGAAQKLSADQLHAAAEALGYGRPNQLGVDAFMGSVPATASQVEHAADAIGQGQVLTSPLVVASVAASVAAGHYAPPRLVLASGGADGAGSAGDGAASPSASGDPSSSAPAPAADASSPAVSSPAADGSSPAAAPAVTPLPAAPITALQGLMAEVVTSGTGTALKGVPGDPVHGKTGTAEFGNANPPATHAWFTGYQGDVAFAVVVEGGGFGGKVAAPLAADFLRRLPA